MSKKAINKLNKKPVILALIAGAILLIAVIAALIVMSAKSSSSNTNNDNIRSNGEGSDSQTRISLIADDPASTTTFVTVNGEDYKQIRIPVACNIMPSDYTFDSSGYLKKSNGEKANNTLATTGATEKYIQYGSLACITDGATLKYNLPEDYSFRNNLGTAYRVSDNQEDKTISVHIDHLAVFADGSVGYSLSDDYRIGTSIMILDDQNEVVDVYYIKLNPQVIDNFGVQFLNDWKSTIDSRSSRPNTNTSSGSSSASKTDWEAYCRDVFPGNNSYDRTARESCVRSAQASEDMMNGKYTR